MLTLGPNWDFTTACPNPATPSGASPFAGATNQLPTVDLSWADSGDATSWDVSFGETTPPPFLGNTDKNYYTLDKLKCSAHYYWTIVARNACGYTKGPIWDFSTTSLPAAPSGPTPASGAANQMLDMDLDWADSARATSYDVYFGTASPPPLHGNTAASYYALPDLTCATHYYWKIVAKNACGSTSGTVWDFSTTCCLPAVPSGPSPATGAASQPLGVDLDWANASGATSYDVYFGTTTSPPFWANTSASNYALPVLTCNADYYWKIVAKNSCGGTIGPLWHFSTVCCMPGAPSGPSPTDGAANQSLSVDLDWADASGATSYDVYFGTTTPPPKVGTASSSSYALGTLTCGMRYYWKIVAKNTCGTTSGPEWDFTTTCCMPGTPSGPTPANGGTNQALTVDLDWVDASGATSYDVYFGTSASPPWVASTSSSSYALPTLSYNTRYYWKIVAKSACGNTAGPVWNFTTHARDFSWKIRLPIVLRQ
jgi:hypothetical protein